MIPPAPETVKKSLGSETTEALARWFQDILENNAVSWDEYREIPPRLDNVETRLQNVETRLQNVETRLQNVETKLEVLDQDVSELRDEFKEFRREITQRFDVVHGRFDRMHEHLASMTKWTVGTLALFGTLITILLTISQFFK